ncbi:MAG: hypothetical protein QOE65_2023 [Solirubrobacteraceae bacterium]|nr:hypothetical protein [Solirubrobacteraceae bacterium]
MPPQKDVLLDVLRMNPSMEAAAYALPIVERAVPYPIEDLGSLLAPFARRREVKVGERTVNAEQVKEFLPEECFPIADREELISRLVMALERERMSVIASLPRR